jgi:Type IV secretion system proteins
MKSKYAVALYELLELRRNMDLIHDPSLGAAMGLMNLAGVGNSLPVNPTAVMGMVNGFSGGVGSLTSSLGRLNQLNGLITSTGSANHVYTPTDGSWSSQQLIDGSTAVAGTQGGAASLLQDLQSHIPILQALRDRLSSATNMKDVADAQGAIQSEIAWTANTQAQLNAMGIAAAAQNANRDQRDNEAMSQSFNAFVTKYGG